MANKKIPVPKWKQVANHQLTAITFGFILTTVLGIILTNNYSVKQKELEFALSDKQKDREREKDKELRAIDREKDQKEKEREQERVKNEKEIEEIKNRNQRELEYQRSLYQKEIERERSFADEINKTRVQKIGEVWTKIYELDRLFDGGSMQIRDAMMQFSSYQSMLQPKDGKPQLGPLASQSAYKQVELAAQKMTETKILLERATDEANATVNKNRFWIGEEFFVQFDRYIDINRKIANSAMGGNLEILRNLFNERDKARANIVLVRKSLLSK